MAHVWRNRVTIIVWVLLVLTAPAAAQSTAPGVPVYVAPQGQPVIVHLLPDASSPPLMQLNNETPFNALGRRDDNTWVALDLGDGLTGWTATEHLRTDAQTAIAALPVTPAGPRPDPASRALLEHHDAPCSSHLRPRPATRTPPGLLHDRRRQHHRLVYVPHSVGAQRLQPRPIPKLRNRPHALRDYRRNSLQSSLRSSTLWLVHPRRPRPRPGYALRLPIGDVTAHLRVHL